MKKLLYIAAFLISYIAKGQTIQLLGSPTTQIYVRGQLRVDTVFYLPLRDTTFTPAQIGALVVKSSNNTLYLWNGLRWQGIATGNTVWGGITGTLISQTDLYDSLLARQPTLTAGYGEKIVGATISIDTANFRKVDTVLRKNDSTLTFKINGASYDVLLRGTAAGGISSLSLNVPNGLYTSPVVFSNSGGAWTGSMILTSQLAGTMLAGPVTGAPAQPTFRVLTTSDLPTGIPNGNLANSSITLTMGSSGTAPNFSAGSVSLGGGIVLNIPQASSTTSGFLSATDWTTFNNAATPPVISVNFQQGNVITLTADSLKELPVDTSNNRNGYILAFDSVAHKWKLVAGTPSSGTVTSVAATVPTFLTLTGTPITVSGTLAFGLASQSANTGFFGPVSGGTTPPTFRSLVIADLPATGVTPGTYNSVTVNAQGGITAGSIVGSGITSLNGLTGGTQTFATGTSGSNFNIISTGTTHTFNIPYASASDTGMLTAADWNTFNNKISGITQLTSDVTAGPGTGSQAATIAANAVTNTKLAQGPANTIKGNNTGSTANEVDLTTTQATAMWNPATSSLQGVMTALQYRQLDSVYRGLIQDSTFLRNKGTSGTQLAYITGSDTLNIKKLVAGTNITIATNSDSSITITGAGSGSGTVASFSAGALSPLFTTSVATATTTPALTFSLSNAGAHSFFGNFTGSTGAPSFSSPTLASGDFANQGTTTAVLHGNASGNPSWGAVALTTDVSGTLPVANGGTGTSSPGLIQGTNVTITGSWPNQTINSSGGGGSFLTSTNVGYGSVSNTLTGTSEFIYNHSATLLTVPNFTASGAVNLTGIPPLGQLADSAITDSGGVIRKIPISKIAGAGGGIAVFTKTLYAYDTAYISSDTLYWAPGYAISPTAFGAKADCNGSSGNGTDCTAAFRACLAWANAHGCAMFIPPVPIGQTGKGFRITDSISLKGMNVTVFGYGMSSLNFYELTGTVYNGPSVIYMDHPTHNAFVIDSSSSNVYPVVKFHDFDIRNISSLATASAAFVFKNNNQEGRMENISTEYFYYGINSISANLLSLINCNILYSRYVGVRLGNNISPDFGGINFYHVAILSDTTTVNGAPFAGLYITGSGAIDWAGGSTIAGAFGIPNSQFQYGVYGNWQDGATSDFKFIDGFIENLSRPFHLINRSGGALANLDISHLSIALYNPAAANYNPIYIEGFHNVILDANNFGSGTSSTLAAIRVDSSSNISIGSTYNLNDWAVLDSEYICTGVLKGLNTANFQATLTNNLSGSNAAIFGSSNGSSYAEGVFAGLAGQTLPALVFHPITSNTANGVWALPNGTGGSAFFATTWKDATGLTYGTYPYVEMAQSSTASYLLSIGSGPLPLNLGVGTNTNMIVLNTSNGININSPIQSNISVQAGVGSTTAPQFQSGDFYLQTLTVGSNDVFGSNSYYNSGWTRANTGYTAGDNMYQGQHLFYANNTAAAGTFTPNFIGKLGYDGGFVFGNTNASATNGVYTGGWFSSTAAGVLAAPHYGFGIVTGTAATYPAFTSTGQLIESTTPYGGVTTVGSFSGSSQTNGAAISGTTITFGPADGTNPGMVTTGSQTIAGTKTFSGAVNALHLGGSSGSLSTGSLGTNVTSMTITGNDNHFQIVMVTSGAVSGTLGTITFASTWSSTPYPTISAKDATTGSNVASTVGGYIALSGQTTTTALLTGNITLSGTYTFNVSCGN